MTKQAKPSRWEGKLGLFQPTYVLHPRYADAVGPFAVLTREVFDTPAEAAQWAWDKLGPDRDSWKIVYHPGLDPWHLIHWATEDDREAIHADLCDIRKALYEYGPDSTDVRLAVDDFGGSYRWQVWYGAVDYDAHHSTYCAAGTVNAADTADGLRALAADLISDIEDQIAEVL